MTGALYFDDLVVGQVFQSGTVTMERERIIAFAREFDPQPQHIGEDEARGSMFGTLVASGWHTASVSMRLQLEAMMHRFPGGAMGAQVDMLGWRRPVHPGDVLHVVIEVMDMRPSRSRPASGVLTLRTRTINQRDETVQEMTASVLAPRRPLGGPLPRR